MCECASNAHSHRPLQGEPTRHDGSARLDRAGKLGYSPYRMKRSAEVTSVDLDDLMPSKKPSGVVIGENLSTLSVAELEKRITDLESEIERVRVERDKKRKHEAAAQALFKS